jgi:hypothetical protein
MELSVPSVVWCSAPPHALSTVLKMAQYASEHRAAHRPCIFNRCFGLGFVFGLFVVPGVALKVCARRRRRSGLIPHALRRRLRASYAAALAPEWAAPRALFLPLLCGVSGRTLWFCVCFVEIYVGEILLGCVARDDRSRVFCGISPVCCLVLSLAPKKFERC